MKTPFLIRTLGALTLLASFSLYAQLREEYTSPDALSPATWSEDSPSVAPLQATSTLEASTSASPASITLPSLESPVCQQARVTTHPAEMTPDFYLRPITKLTESSIRCFIKNVYNSPVYSREIFPACLAHPLDLCSLGASHNLPLSFDERTLNLFHTKLCTATWMNPYALLVFLEDLPRLVAPRIQKNRVAQLDKIQTVLHDALLHHFDDLKRNPQEFLETTSAQIYEAVHTTNGQHELEKFQNMCTRFVEQALSKIVWDPRDQKSVWESICMIGDHLQSWYLLGLLPDSAAYNACIWALLGRFAYFIECTGSQLYPTTYQYILEDLERAHHEGTTYAGEQHAWLSLPELETWITPKRVFLGQAIEEGIIKQRAAAAGIMTDRLF